MRIAFIAAVARNGIIGKDNRVPWKLPADLAYFKRVTMGKPIIMGRKTHESIGRPLPGRENVVLTRDRQFDAEGCVVVHSIEAALRSSSRASEVVVIGGAQVYREFLPLAERIYLTEVHAEIEGDTRFPPIDRSEWREVSREHREPDDQHAHAMSFVVLERRQGGRPRPREGDF